MYSIPRGFNSLENNIETVNQGLQVDLKAISDRANRYSQQ